MPGPLRQTIGLRVVGRECPVSRGDGHLAALGHGVARIQHDVDQRQLQVAGIGLDRPDIGRDIADQLDPVRQ
jgi:hypothetical protein